MSKPTPPGDEDPASKQVNPDPASAAGSVFGKVKLR
jgi:hypothetical protein